MESRLNIEAIVAKTLERIGTPFTFNEGGLSNSVNEQYERRPEQSWRDILNGHVERKLNSERIDIAAAVSATLETIKPDPGD